MFLGIAHMTNFSYKLCSPPSFAPNKKNAKPILRKHSSSEELHNIWKKNPVDKPSSFGRGQQTLFKKKNVPWEIFPSSFPSENQDLHITDKWFGQDQDLHPGLNWYNISLFRNLAVYINCISQARTTGPRRWKGQKKKQQNIYIYIYTHTYICSI